jgi:hypothetical protein
MTSIFKLGIKGEARIQNIEIKPHIGEMRKKLGARLAGRTTNK